MAHSIPQNKNISNSLVNTFREIKTLNVVFGIRKNIPSGFLNCRCWIQWTWGKFLSPGSKHPTLQCQDKVCRRISFLIQSSPVLLFLSSSSLSLFLFLPSPHLFPPALPPFLPPHPLLFLLLFLHFFSFSSFSPLLSLHCFLLLLLLILLFLVLLFILHCFLSPFFFFLFLILFFLYSDKYILHFLIHFNMVLFKICNITSVLHLSPLLIAWSG